MIKLGLQFLNQATNFIHSLPEGDQLKIAMEIESMRQGDFESAYIKTLRGPMKELISRRSRIIFCLEGSTLYILRGFTKKSTKTPKRELEASERIYSILMEQLRQNK